MLPEPGPWENPSIYKSDPEVLIRLNALPFWPFPPATDTNKSVVVTQ